MTIKTHGRMMTSDTIGITQLDLQDGTANQAIVTDGQGVLRFATVGAGGSVGSSVFVEDIRTGDGTTTTFTLSVAAPYEESILTFIDGVAQPTSSFTLPSTTSITFSPAPGNGAAIRICHLGIASSIADCSVTGAKICMGGDTTGDILFYNGTAYQRLVIGTALQILRTNAAVNAPEWVDATTVSLPAVGADGNVLTSDGTNWASEAPLGGVGGELVSIQVFDVAVEQQSPPAGGADQTWTKPAGVTRIEVFCVGGGGASSSTGRAGGGAFARKSYDVTNVTSYPLVIGLPGRFGVAPGNGRGGGSHFNATGGTQISPTGPDMVHAPGGVETAASNDAPGGSWGVPILGGGDLNVIGGHGSRGGDSGGPYGGDVGKGARGGVSGHGDGGTGTVVVYEYGDASAHLVGEKLISHQLLTAASGTWTKPANVTKIRVFVVGHGGAAITNNSGTSTGGGGGGGTGISVVDVTSISTVAYTINSSGSTFSLSTPIVGLQGGTATTSSNDQDNAPGGTAGTATGADLIIPGGVGGTGRDSAGHGAGGVGGLSYIPSFGRGTRGVGNHNSPSGGILSGGGQTAGCIYIEEYSDPSLVSGGLGKVRQLKSNLIGTTDSTTLAFPGDNTIPQITEGKEFCNLSFTPISATSKLLITVQVTYWLSTFARIYVGAFQSGVNDALTTSYDTGDSQTPGEPSTFSFSCVVDSGSTTARTYSMRFGGSGSYTAYINYATRFGGTIKSGLIIQEIEV